jgi:hypothetical protein
MQKCYSLRNKPKSKTNSMFYKNKKTTTKIETPLCAKNTNNIKIEEFNNKYNIWNKKDLNDNKENTVRLKERKFTQGSIKKPFDSDFDINNFYSKNFHKNSTEIGKDDYDNSNKILSLKKEKMYLNNNNITLLQILNENNQKNKELKSYIEEYTKKGLISKAKYLRHIEKLKNKSKEINYDSSFFQKKNVNYQNINEIKKENELLIKKIKIKNNDFQNLYDFMMDIISYSQPYIKQCTDVLNELYSFNNNKINEAQNSYESKMSGEIIEIKNEYEKLKIKYKELLEKMKNEDEKDEPIKQKVKFVVKNISDKSIKEYEIKIQKLKEDNNKLKNDYKLHMEKLKKEINDLNNKNKNKEKEFESLNKKYQTIVQSLSQKLELDLELEV